MFTNADDAIIHLKSRLKVFQEGARLFIARNATATQFSGPRLTKTKVELEA